MGTSVSAKVEAVLLGAGVEVPLRNGFPGYASAEGYSGDAPESSTPTPPGWPAEGCAGGARLWGGLLRVAVRVGGPVGGGNGTEVG
jgi:hypothetical protein